MLAGLQARSIGSHRAASGHGRRRRSGTERSRTHDLASRRHPRNDPHGLCAVERFAADVWGMNGEHEGAMLVPLSGLIPLGLAP